MAIGAVAVGATLAMGAAGVLYVDEHGDQDSVASTSAASAGAQTQERAHRASPHRDSGSAALTDAQTPRFVGPGTNGTGTGGGTGADMSRNAIPGVGELMMSRIPASTRQVIVVTGGGLTDTVNTVTRWQRADADSPWTPVGTEIVGRNGENGWTHDHREGDLRSPVGVYSLTAAGGRRTDPGTRLPYEYRPSYYQTGSYEGDPMARAFNYVVAIDYNRLPGYPPSDPTRPLGEEAGGDIWLHVDHESPTRGCISVPEEAMVEILRWLDPASHPMIIMGDRASITADADPAAAAAAEAGAEAGVTERD